MRPWPDMHWLCCHINILSNQSNVEMFYHASQNTPGKGRGSAFDFFKMNLVPFFFFDLGMACKLFFDKFWDIFRVTVRSWSMILIFFLCIL